MKWSVALALVYIAGPPAGAAPAKPKLPAHYAALFELGHAWTYDVSLTTWDYDKVDGAGKMPKTTERVVITCKVAHVTALAKVTVSEVTCDRDYDRAFRVAGLYAADAAGLHRLDNETLPVADAEVGTLAPALIAARPVARRTVRKDDFFKAKVIDGVRRQGNAWCVFSDTTEIADGGPVSICYGGGLTSGDDDTGGELHHLSWHVH